MTDTATSPMRPALHFVLYLLFTVATVFASTIIAGIVVSIIYGANVVSEILNLTASSTQVVNAMWLLQILGTTLPLFIAPVFYAFVILRQPQIYLKWNKPFPWQLIFITLIIMFFSLPIMEQLSNINQKLTLPPFLKGLEDLIRDYEKRAEKLTNLLLKMNTIWDMIKAVFWVAGITAVVEELTFRGVLQTILVKWTKNHHAAIWITAILFSAFHMEFFGFLPRLMLGIFFGYFVYWTGSIWSSVWAHFINNGLAVLATYLYQHKTITVDPDSTHVFNLTGYILSILVTISFLYNYRNVAITAAQKAKLLKDGE